MFKCLKKANKFLVDFFFSKNGQKLTRFFSGKIFGQYNFRLVDDT